jgi:hypothetical protein
MDGTRPNVTSAPLMDPATRPVRSPIASKPGVPTPCPAPTPIATDDSAMIAATEMSISPAMISNASGNATSARSVKLNVASESVSTSRKYGDTTENSTNPAMNTAASIVSQRKRNPRAAFMRATRGWFSDACVAARRGALPPISRRR